MKAEDLLLADPNEIPAESIPPDYTSRQSSVHPGCGARSLLLFKRNRKV